MSRVGSRISSVCVVSTYITLFMVMIAGRRVHSYGHDPCFNDRVHECVPSWSVLIVGHGRSGRDDYAVMVR